MDDEPIETVAQFAKRLDLTMDCLPIHDNPNMTDKAWKADHWSCELRHYTSRGSLSVTLVVYYSQGIGHRGRYDNPRKPKIADVLDSLRSDVEGIDQSFADWASDLGMSDDSIAARRTYDRCVDLAKRLRSFLGADGYAALLRTERL